MWRHSREQGEWILVRGGYAQNDLVRTYGLTPSRHVLGLARDGTCSHPSTPYRHRVLCDNEFALLVKLYLYSQPPKATSVLQTAKYHLSVELDPDF
jgi:hypothetical protein